MFWRIFIIIHPYSLGRGHNENFGVGSKLNTRHLINPFDPASGFLYVQGVVEDAAVVWKFQKNWLIICSSSSLKLFHLESCWFDQVWKLLVWCGLSPVHRSAKVEGIKIPIQRLRDPRHFTKFLKKASNFRFPFSVRVQHMPHRIENKNAICICTKSTSRGVSCELSSPLAPSAAPDDEPFLPLTGSASVLKDQNPPGSNLNFGGLVAPWLTSRPAGMQTD